MKKEGNPGGRAENREPFGRALRETVFTKGGNMRFIRHFLNRFFIGLSFLPLARRVRRGSLPFEGSRFNFYSGQDLKTSNMRFAADRLSAAPRSKPNSVLRFFLEQKLKSTFSAICRSKLIHTVKSVRSGKAGLTPCNFVQRGFIQSVKTKSLRYLRWIAVLTIMGGAGSGMADKATLRVKCKKEWKETHGKSEDKLDDMVGTALLVLESENETCNTKFPDVSNEGVDNTAQNKERELKREACEKRLDELKSISKCTKLERKGGEESDCEEKADEFRKAKKEADKACSRIDSGIGQCMAVMRSCEDCPDEKKGKRCVILPGRAKCPQLAGSDLEDLKEEIREGKEMQKELQQDIKELRDEIVEKEGEKVTAEKEYKEEIHTLQNDLQTAQEEMENEVKEQQAEIDGNLQKAVDGVKGELSKSLKIQHTFVNEIAKVERKRREDTAKIHRECRYKASAQLAAYRKHRRKAIRDGRYGNKGVRKVMGKARVSFTKQDNIRYRSYHSSCLSENADNFKAIEENHKTAMRMIEQQKQQVLASFKALQAQVQQLNNQAYQQKNTIVQEFAKNTDKALKKFQANQARRHQNYQAEMGQMARALSNLNAQLQRKQGELRTAKEREGLNTAYMQRARQKGASSKTSDGESRVSEAQGALAELRDTAMPVYDKCCSEGKDGESVLKIVGDDCNEFLDKFNTAFGSSIKFEGNKNKENRKSIDRAMDIGGSR